MKRPNSHARSPRRAGSQHSRRRRHRRALGNSAAEGARARLKNFRQASIVAVALTGLLLFFVSPDEAGSVQQEPAAADTLPEVPDTVAIIERVPLEELQEADTAAVKADSAAAESAEEATGTLRDLWSGFVGNLPKYGIALGILIVAWLLVRLVRPLIRRVLGRWARSDAIALLMVMAIWLLALGVAMSVLVGDIRALVGSLGLVGLALSWALQTPIESFTGWLLNSFRGYYRIGDRIAVKERDVYGDVYRIDLLTTTVWEYGGVERLGVPVRGEQATGRLITFPNNEVLSGTVINYTQDFPYVWDELSIEFSGSTDVDYLLETMKRIADEVLGDHMAAPAREYGAILRSRGLEPGVADEPQVYVSISETGWLLATIRYIVGERERRSWKSLLVARVMQELQTPESQERIKGALPKRLVQFLDTEGQPAGVPWEGGEGAAPPGD